MKEILQQLSEYNIWANQRIVDAILSFPEEDWTLPYAASFPSYYASLLHMWDAESIWWQRLKLQEVVVAPSVHFKGNARDVAAALLHQSNLFKTWIEKATPAALDHVFAYQNSKKEQFKQPVYQMLLQVFNHGTYHRGQLISMLHQAGVKKMPNTDFISWCRLKGKANSN